MSANDYRPLLRNGAGGNGDSPLAAGGDVELAADKIDAGVMISPASPTALVSPRSFSERVPPEWAVLLLGCALGLATGASVVLFNLAVHGIHNLAWAGTPAEGAAWLRVQPITTTWHRIMLIPVMGGVVVGMLHALGGIIEQSQSSSQNQGQNRGSTLRLEQQRGIDWGAAFTPVIRAIQAAVTLGTGSSLGPEGPSVDIGKAWADGMAEILMNTHERKTALVAAGAAAGISSGFNAAVAGCFFAIETVLQSVASENAPPLTTAMIILASVLSSTVSNVVLGEEPAFTVPEYELKSAAELPLYLLLGMVCGVISVIFTRLIKWSTAFFDFLRDRLGIPPAVTPALGGLCVGFIALQYPGVLYWGFSNVNEILHSRESASAPGPKLMTQLIAAKIVATALCRGSGLVGGIYAPSLFIGSAVGSVYGSLAGAAIQAAIPGKAEVAAPQAYALVGMAAMLASVCSVPLTSVLLLFELTKDYRILLPLMGAVGLAYWVSSVANRKKAVLPHSKLAPGSAAAFAAGSHSDSALTLYSPLGTAINGHSPPLHINTHHNLSHLHDHSTHFTGPPLSPTQLRASSSISWHRGSSSTGGSGAEDVELCAVEGFAGGVEAALSVDRLLDELKVAAAMSTTFVSVRADATVREAVLALLEGRSDCAMVVDAEGLLEGTLSLADVHRELRRSSIISAAGTASHRGSAITGPGGSAGSVRGSLAAGMAGGLGGAGGGGGGGGGSHRGSAVSVGLMPVGGLDRTLSHRASVAGSELAPVGLEVHEMLVGAVCTGKTAHGDSDLVVCFPDQTLRAARHLMLPRNLVVLPVVSRSGKRWQDRGRKLVGVLDASAIRATCQAEATRRILGVPEEPQEAAHGAGGH
ncbi:hypothetical protein CLOM_g17467 [Closterium sp. NIES-68]|nr:hypothetical protein CLOM_g17467 [Closterium sp. NIES-68]GJP74868.1 hypothetical protein CLOP_g5396 [Closterium sp. NIES-67]